MKTKKTAICGCILLLILTTPVSADFYINYIGPGGNSTNTGNVPLGVGTVPFTGGVPTRHVALNLDVWKVIVTKVELISDADRVNGTYYSNGTMYSNYDSRRNPAFFNPIAGHVYGIAVVFNGVNLATETALVNPPLHITNNQIGLQQTVVVTMNQEFLGPIRFRAALGTYGLPAAGDPDGQLNIYFSVVSEPPEPTGELRFEQQHYREGSQPRGSWEIDRGSGDTGSEGERDSGSGSASASAGDGGSGSGNDSSSGGSSAKISAAFTSNNTFVTAQSTKDISNVVLRFMDEAHEKLDGLSGYTGTFKGSGDNAGKQIKGVWIKSGNNASGDGPGYGQYVDNTNLPD